MKKIQKLLALCLTSLAFACGAEDSATNDGPEVEEIDAPFVELGTAEQPIFAPRGPVYVLGSTTTDSGLRCTRTSSGQACDVPTAKFMKYCSVGLNASENGQLGAVGIGASNQTSPFRFQTTELFNGVNPVRDADCTAAFNAGTAQIMINVANNICASAGASATNIDTLVCGNPSVVTGLLPEVPSVPGSFRGILGGIIHVDRARLLAAFPLNTDRARVLAHGLGHQGARLIGLGARTEDPFTTFLWTRRQVQPISILGRTKTVGEECVTNFYSATGGTNYTTDAFSCDRAIALPE